LFAGVHMTGTVIRDKALPVLLGYLETDIDWPMELLVGPQAFALFVGLGILFFRRRVIKRAQALIHADFLEYNAAWQKLISQADVQNYMNDLAALLARLKCSRIMLIRQLHHDRKEQATTIRIFSSYPEIHSGDGVTCQETVIGPPIHSLDQVFFQAKCINPIFLRKVRKLAIACNGGGTTRCSHRPDNSTDSLDDRQLLMGTSGLVFQLASKRGVSGEHGNINWGSVKSVNRAIEKTIRAYKGVRLQHLIACKVLN
jgi:hypothetical protein